MADHASHALASSATVKPTFNDEEEVVVIRNGWTPKEEENIVSQNVATRHVFIAHKASSKKIQSYT